jgi:hypothetical protein
MIMTSRTLQEVRTLSSKSVQVERLAADRYRKQEDGSRQTLSTEKDVASRSVNRK